MQVGHNHRLPILCLITRRELTVCPLTVTLRRRAWPHGEFVFHMILKPLTDYSLCNWSDHNAAGARSKWCSRCFVILQQQAWTKWFVRPLYWDVERKWKKLPQFYYSGTVSSYRDKWEILMSSHAHETDHEGCFERFCKEMRLILTYLLTYLRHGAESFLRS